MAQPQDTGRALETGSSAVEQSATNDTDPRPETQPGPETGLLTIAEFSRQFGPRTTKIFALLNSGELEGRRFGGRTYITRASAERWAASLPKWTSTKADADASRARRRA